MFLSRSCPWTFAHPVPSVWHSLLSFCMCKSHWYWSTAPVLSPLHPIIYCLSLFSDLTTLSLMPLKFFASYITAIFVCVAPKPPSTFADFLERWQRGGLGRERHIELCVHASVSHMLTTVGQGPLSLQPEWAMHRSLGNNQWENGQIISFLWVLSFLIKT